MQKNFNILDNPCREEMIFILICKTAPTFRPSPLSVTAARCKIWNANAARGRKKVVHPCVPVSKII
jgi:hypothetical protein